MNIELLRVLQQEEGFFIARRRHRGKKATDCKMTESGEIEESIFLYLKKMHCLDQNKKRNSFLDKACTPLAQLPFLQDLQGCFVWVGQIPM